MKTDAKWTLLSLLLATIGSTVVLADAGSQAGSGEMHIALPLEARGDISAPIEAPAWQQLERRVTPEELARQKKEAEERKKEEEKKGGTGADLNKHDTDDRPTKRRRF